MNVGYVIVEGDLLESDDRYIVHQCNCVTTGASGIARAIFDRFPWADVYSPREGKRGLQPGQRPGDIAICGDGVEHRFVINLFGQLRGGGPGDAGSGDDATSRKWMFVHGLEKIFAMGAELGSVAFPWRIGCGIAGGDWEGFYEPALVRFADGLSGVGVPVRVHRLPGTT